MVITSYLSYQAAGDFVDIREKVEDDSIETKGKWIKNLYIYTY